MTEHPRRATLIDKELIQLKRDLAAVVSAEAFFSLTDLCKLSADNAIASLVRTARTITEAALPDIGALQA